jgi:Na+/proline symporter
MVPRYYRLKVITAYEFLESRFDRKTRQLAAFLFLLQRGLSAGITIYAPAIVLSSVLGWPLKTTNAVIGVLVIVYTVSGGSRAVSQTQRWQMIVMLGGMAAALGYIVHELPAGVGLRRATAIAGALGRMNVVDFGGDMGTRYTFWSGMTGGLFVALAYFGTDQSQVGRYIGAKSLAESRLGLLMNGLVKIPMQFGILFVGVMVLVFHQFHRPPVFFNAAELAKARATPVAEMLSKLETEHAAAFVARRPILDNLLHALDTGDAPAQKDAIARLRAADLEDRRLRARARSIVHWADPRAETRDADYVFLSFVLEHFPPGLIGLLLAVILCAAMSASAGELTALGQATMVDFYRRSFRPAETDAHYLRVSKGLIAGWGLFAIAFATFAALLDNLIQAVNILGSLFYGPILGIFLAALFLRRARSTPVFVSAIVAEVVVLACYARTSIGFLWYNVIGCGVVLAGALLTLGSGAPARD